MAALLGPLLVLVFTLSQAFRDVYFGNAFQHLDFFMVILLAFSLSTAIFAVVALIRAPGDFRKLIGHLGTIVIANVTTAISWACFFFALTYIDPAVVNAIHSAMGPLTVVVLGAFGIKLAQLKPVGPIECAGYAGIAASVAGLWFVVLGGYSGLAVTNLTTGVTGLALLTVSGVSIAISLLYCKRLQDRGIGADTVTTVRYLVLIVFAAVVVFWKGEIAAVDSAQLGVLSLIATAIIVLPLYAFQLGIGRTSPLTAQVIRSLGPVFVFALEQIDGRLHYSAPTLVCLLIYSGSVVLTNVAHGWLDKPERARATPTPALSGSVRSRSA